MIHRDESHIYRDESGKIFISVTQNLAIAGLVDFSMVKPVDLEYARLRGQYIHDAIDKHLLDDLDIEAPELEGYRDYIKAYIQFEKDHQWEAYKSEGIVYDELLRTAGQFDQVGKKGNNIGGYRLTVLDIKTAVTVSEVARLQLAAYQDFYNQDQENENKITARICLQLLPTGKYKVFWYKDKQDIHIFKCICRTNWWALSNRIIPMGAQKDKKVLALCQEIIKG